MKRQAGALGVAAVLLLAGCATESQTPSSSSSSSTPRTVHPPRTATSNPAAPGVPLARSDDKDYAPRADEIPADVGSIPDAVPQAEERSAYGNPSSYEVYGKRYEILGDARGFRERGLASWYGKKFHGKRTSSGAPYDMFAMTGAHKTLPIPCYVRVTNVANGKQVVIRINDRGPFHSDRIVDLSYAAANRLDIINHGSALVELEVVTPGDVAETVVAAADNPSTQAATASKRPLQSEKPPVVVAQPAPLHVGTPRYLQAGVFADAINAAAFRDKLTAVGVKPLLMKSEQRNSRWTYRILIGPFADMRLLDAARAKLSADATPTIPVVD